MIKKNNPKQNTATQDDIIESILSEFLRFVLFVLGLLSNKLIDDTVVVYVVDIVDDIVVVYVVDIVVVVSVVVSVIDTYSLIGIESTQLNTNNNI